MYTIEVSCKLPSLHTTFPYPASRHPPAGAGRRRGAQGHRPLVTNALSSLKLPQRCRAAWVVTRSLTHSPAGSVLQHQQHHGHQHVGAALLLHCAAATAYLTRRCCQHEMDWLKAAVEHICSRQSTTGLHSVRYHENQEKQLPDLSIKSATLQPTPGWFKRPYKQECRLPWQAELSTQQRHHS
jgi:hypothetical protein